MSKYSEKISREEFERIERYLHGGMDADEHAEFERQLSADDILRREVELQAQLIGAVEVGSFKTNIITEQGKQASPTRYKLIAYWQYAAAAVVVIGLGIAGWWFSEQQSMSKSDLYTSYFRPDLGLPVVMGSDSTKYLFNEGMVSYKEGHYKDAIGIWKELVEENGVTTDTLDYYIGVAYMNMDNHAKASGYLTSISKNEQSVFHEKAIWYLALLKLKKEEYMDAKRLLSQLPEKRESAELLEKMSD